MQFLFNFLLSLRSVQFLSCLFLCAARPRCFETARGLMLYLIRGWALLAELTSRERCSNATSRQPSHVHGMPAAEMEIELIAGDGDGALAASSVASRGQQPNRRRSSIADPNGRGERRRSLTRRFITYRPAALDALWCSSSVRRASFWGFGDQVCLEESAEAHFLPGGVSLWLAELNFR